MKPVAHLLVGGDKSIMGHNRSDTKDISQSNGSSTKPKEVDKCCVRVRLSRACAGRAYVAMYLELKQHVYQ